MRLRSIDKLYGRDQELHELNGIYRDVLENGTSQIVLLESYAGNGKSTLVNHFGNSLHKQTCPLEDQPKAAKSQPRFIRGKFDAQNQKPYAAFEQAFSVFTSYLLRNQEQEKERIEGIREAVGSEWEIFQEIIPNLRELLLGTEQEQQKGPLTNNTGSRTSVNAGVLKRMAQFQFRLKSFVRAACSTAPVVLYLDDLHWADRSSLELLKALVSDGNSRNLLLLGSYRGHEIDDNHPLSWTIAHILDESYRGGAQLTEMVLSDLSFDDLNQFLAHTLDLVPEKTMSLSKVLQSKTNGNILYSSQILQHLVDKKLVRYDMTYYQWTWEVDEIVGATDLSENVVELVASRILQLPEEVIDILKIASCLWYSFEVPVLEFIVANAQDRLQQKAGTLRLALEDSRELQREVDAQHQSAVIQGLRRAAELGLLDEVGTNGFKFAHDRIREATYSLIAEGQERDSMHLVIGELLWCMFHSEKSQQWMLFSSVDQLDKVSYQFHDVKIRYELAEINLEAAECAIDVAALLPAIQYLQSGIQFLGDKRWSQCYTLCLTLHSKLAQLESSVGRREESEKLVDIILKNAKSFDDKLPAYATLVESLGVGGKLQESLKLAYEVLDGLGEAFPKKTTGRHFQRTVQRDALLTRRLLAPHSDATILALPRLQDRRKEYALRIINGKCLTQLLKDRRWYSWHHN